MASRNVNTAVAAYRALVKAEWKVVEAETALHGALRKVKGDRELADYVRLTSEIDRAVDEVDAKTEHMAPSTRKQLATRAMNSAGTD